MIRSTTFAANRAKSAFGLLAALTMLFTAGLAVSEETKGEKAKPSGDSYPLKTCSVSEHELDSMGGPVTHMHEGREIKFCCAECVKDFEKNPADYIKKIDAEIIKQQSASYPTAVCVVSGDDLMHDGKPIEVVYNNRLVKLCCADCEPAMKKNPAKYLAKLDQAIIEKQKAAYPLDTCVVSGKKLGSMGDPLDIVVNGRLVRLCCAGCEKPVRTDPAKYFAKIDEAAKAKK